jgi:hypothetical protein
MDSNAMQLFDLVSQDETDRPSHVETVDPTSRSSTSLSQSHDETKPIAAPVSDDDGTLDRVADAARAVAESSDALDYAVAAARRAGHSWRAIGCSAGIPFQTLHRRAPERGR